MQRRPWGDAFVDDERRQQVLSLVCATQVAKSVPDIIGASLDEELWPATVNSSAAADAGDKASRVYGACHLAGRCLTRSWSHMCSARARWLWNPLHQLHRWEREGAAGGSVAQFFWPRARMLDIFRERSIWG